MTIEDKQLEKIDGWPLGINNIAKETELPNGSLREAVNVDLSDGGKPKRRRGYVQRYAGNTSSLYNAIGLSLFSENGSLHRLFPDYSTADLSIPVRPNAYVSYASVNNEILYMDGENSGRINSDGGRYNLGLDTPETVPQGTAITGQGGLRAGSYKWCVTYVDEWGQESGATQIQHIDVEEGGGIQLADLPNDNTDAAYVNVYRTEVDGETLFLEATVPFGTTTVLLEANLLGRPLETEHMDKLPVGHIVRYHKGRVLSAYGNILYYSEPLRFGLTYLHKNFFPFSSRITNVIPVIDGVYIVADATYYIAGTNYSDVRQMEVSPATGVEGTDALVDPTLFKVEGVQEKVGYWFSSKGAVLGIGGGAIIPIMEDRAEVETYTTGATMLREENGISQMITSLTGGDGSTGFRAADVASAEIRRNGIII